MELNVTRRGFVGATATAALASVATAGVAAPNQALAEAAEADTAAAFTKLNPQSDAYKAYTTDFAALYEPLQIGTHTLRNRYVKSPAGSDTLDNNYAAETGELNEGFLAYYENFAKGGAALVFMETAISKMISVKVTADGPSTSGWLFDGKKTIADRLRPLPERLHAAGALAGIQLGAGSFDPATATVEDLHWLQQTMIDLAVEYKGAGFDVVELHTSAGQSVKNLLVGRFNTREDEYGCQNVENRTRFLCEVIAGIKEACGPELAIQILMDAVEDNDASIGDNDCYITMADAVANAQAFEAAGADTFYLRLSVPGRHVSQFAPDLMFSGYKSAGITAYGTQFDYSQHFDGMVLGEYNGAAMLLKCAAELKKHTSKPVSCAGCMDPRLAPDLLTNAVANGEVDYFMMTRSLTVDPEMPNKLKEGRREDVAPCCHCLHCHAKGGPAVYTRDKGAEFCRVNAKTQFAYTDAMPEGYEVLPAATAKKVVVVGAGPAGLEAARVAAERGHNVTLIEKSGILGGLLPVARAYKGEHECLGDLIDYLVIQCEKLGVEIVTGVEADAATVASYNPEAVVVAVGGKREQHIDGAMGFDQVMGAELGERIAIVGGGLQATDLALYLIAQGKKVQIVHDQPQSELAKEQSMWVRTYVIPHLCSQGVKIWNSCTVDGLGEDGLAITQNTGVQQLLKVDTVIEVCDMVPNTALADELAATYETYTVGDAANPWNIALAIRTGNFAARKI